jgi:4-hydroxy-3-methylbut-2-enyl diphosphate reductase
MVYGVLNLINFAHGDVLMIGAMVGWTLLQIIAKLAPDMPGMLQLAIAIAEPKKGDICYATTNRQHAVKFMAPQVDLVIVVGSPSSSNSSRLREVAQKNGVMSHMVDHAEQIDPRWLEGKRRIGVTAGASAPEILVEQVVARLNSLGTYSVRELDGVEEHVTFPLPKGLNPRPAAA